MKRIAERHTHPATQELMPVQGTTSCFSTRMTGTPLTPARHSTMLSAQTMPKWPSDVSEEYSNTEERSRSPTHHTRTILMPHIPTRPSRQKTSSTFRISSGTPLSRSSFTGKPSKAIRKGHADIHRQRGQYRRGT